MTGITTEERIKTAFDRFEEGWTCSQAVISAFCGDFGLDGRLANELALGFSRGMRRGDTCGVVTAGIMVIGLWSSGQNGDEEERKRLCFEMVSRFTDSFEARHKSANCRDIIGYDVRDPLARQKSAGHNRSLCGQVVSDGVRTLAEVMKKAGM